MISTTIHDRHKKYFVKKVKESLKTRKNGGMVNTEALVPIGYIALVSRLL